MSLHRNDFLVSAHQAELHRHAADARLAKTARRPSTATPQPGIAKRGWTGLVAAIRPVRRAAADVMADAVKPAPAPTRAQG